MIRSDIIISDAQYDQTLIKSNWLKAHVITSSKLVGKAKRPEPDVTGQARFTHIGDPMLAPIIDSNPRSITTLTENQSIFLFCLDQRVPFLTLKNVVVTGDGISVSGQTSGRYITGSVKEYLLHIDTTEPGGVTGSIRWQFEERDDYVIEIQAIKTLLWPCRPLYPMTDVWTWNTAVIETLSSEQRLANSPHPLRSLSYKYYCSRPMANTLERLLERVGLGAIDVPLWPEAIDGISIEAGETQMTVNAGLINFVGEAVLYESDERYEVIRVIEQDETSLTLAIPANRSFENVSLVPLVSAISTSGLNVQYSGRYGNASITFHTPQPLTLEPASFEETFLTLPILTRFKKGRSTTHTPPLESRITSANQYTYHLKRYLVHKQLSIELIDIDRQRVKRRFYGVNGRLTPLWVVMPEGDIVLAKHCTKAQLHIVPAGMNDAFSSGVYLYLNWQSGTEIVRALPNGYDTDGNEVLLMETDDITPVTPHDLSSGHVMVLMRCENDQFEFEDYRDYTTLKLNLVALNEGDEIHASD